MGAGVPSVTPGSSMALCSLLPNLEKGLGLIPSTGQGIPFLPPSTHISPQSREVAKGRGEHLPATRRGVPVEQTGRIMGRGYLQARAPATRGGGHIQMVRLTQSGLRPPPCLLEGAGGVRALGGRWKGAWTTGMLLVLWAGRFRAGWAGPTGRWGLGWARGWARGCQPGCRAGSRWARCCGRLGVGAVLGGSRGGGVRAW